MTATVAVKVNDRSVLSNRPTRHFGIPTRGLYAFTLAETVTRRVQSVQAAESVYVKTRSWGFECWMVVNGSTEEERFRLYDIQWELMEQHPEIGFKFHLIDRRDQLSYLDDIERETGKLEQE